MKFIDVSSIIVSSFDSEYEGSYYINTGLITSVVADRNNINHSHVFLAGEAIEEFVVISLTPEQFIKVVKDEN
tara:strand:+ start:409 stop:627 length:219 start_codon:yes stop_codon:yes gene_type:complete